MYIGQRIYDFKTIFGRIAADGSITFGSGFSVSGPVAGGSGGLNQIFTVTFTSAFSTRPVVVATVETQESYSLDTITASGFEFGIHNTSPLPFSFMALGEPLP